MNIFAPGPAANHAVSDPEHVQNAFRRWRTRILISTIIGYATFYLVRKNLGVAMPLMEKELAITKSGLGLFLTLHGVVYGFSKFINGMLGDRSNARIFMTFGLFASAAMNVGFGLGSAVATLGIFWLLNGWFQGMGFPPCARLMTHWFPPRQLATKMSLWNISHSIGAGVAVVLCGYLARTTWRLCFLVPAVIASGSALYLWLVLPDTPTSVGLPEVPGTEAAGKSKGTSFNTFIVQNVFGNPFIWLLGTANFFVYTIRYTVLDWGPTLLVEAKGLELTHAAWIVAAFEFCGLLGMLLSGWLTDRYFGARGARTCVVFMAFAGLTLLLFWKIPHQSSLVSTALLGLAGFFIYGPQCLVGIIAANLATKRAAASAVGLTGLFGYASTVLSGWGMGALVQHAGWDAAFKTLVGISVVGTLLFAAAWKSKAHGYVE